MMNIQKYGVKKSKSRNKPIRFRITQLASTSVDKFIKLGAQAGTNHIKRHFSCQKKIFELPLSNTINLFFNENTVVSKKKSKQIQKITEGPIDKLYNSKKKNYSNYLKQSRLKIKSTANNQSLNIYSKPRHVSHINFNQTLFYKDANLITRKRKGSKKNKQISKHSKAESGGFSQVVIILPKELSKTEKHAFKSFLQVQISQKQENQHDIDQEDFVIQEKQSQIIVQSSKQECKARVKTEDKKLFMIRTHSEHLNMKLPNENFVPFKKLTEKRKPFTFALFQKQNKLNAHNNAKLLTYKDFLWKINYSNGLYVKPSQAEPTYKFFVGWGNNGKLIKSAIKRRHWWTISQNYDDCNFVWSQLKMPSVFSRQFNFEESSKITKKVCKLNLEQKQIRLKSNQHYKIFNVYDMVNWIVHEQKYKSSEVTISEKTYKNRTELIMYKQIRRIQNSQKLVLHNHFVTNGYIGNKKALFYNLKRYSEMKNKNVFQIIPFTVHISKGIEDQEWTHFKDTYQQYQTQKKHYHIQNIWIMKPGENSNRGIGITVCHDIEDIRLRLKSRQRNKDGSLRTFILQKYIERPLLYHERKFDTRHYLLMSCINGKFKAYWYKQGYIRTSSSIYSVKRGTNLFAHLTNDAIQKDSDDYGKYEPGNKVSYQKFNLYLTQIRNAQQNYFFEKILPKMKEMATQAVRSTFIHLDAGRKLNNFELFGMDFMIDSELKPWLIEINTNPCLETNCPLLARIIPKLIEETFQICLDPLFPPPNEWPNNKNLWISQNPLQNINFELIFDEERQGEEIMLLMKSSMNGIKAKIGEVEEQQIIQESNI